MLLHRCASFVAKAWPHKFRPMPFLRGLQLSLSHRSLRGQPAWERVASIKERSLLVNISKCNPCKSCKLFTQGSVAQGGDSCGSSEATKCRNPLGRQSELVRREPVESVRLKRRIRYKQDEMYIHSLNDINILLSTSSSVDFTRNRRFFILGRIEGDISIIY